MEKLKIYHMAKMSNFRVFIKKPLKSCNHRDTYTSMFTTTLCTIARLWKAQVPINSGTDKESMVYTSTQFYSVIRKNEIMVLARK